MRFLRNFNGRTFLTTNDVVEVESGDFEASRVATVGTDGDVSVSFRSTTQVVLHGLQFRTEADAALWVETGYLTKDTQ